MKMGMRWKLRLEIRVHTVTKRKAAGNPKVSGVEDGASTKRQRTALGLVN